MLFGNIKSFAEAMDTARFTRKSNGKARGYRGLSLVVETPPPHWQDDRDEGAFDAR